jgi:hypothetical protein
MAEQYRLWIASRIADDRLVYSRVHAPLDLWFLLKRVGGLPLAAPYYKALQVLGGALIAVQLGLARRKARPELFEDLFALASLWMTLLGPATEGFTYLLLAPALTFAMVYSFDQPRSSLQRSLLIASFSLLLFAVAKNSLAPRWNQIAWIHGIQAWAALLFLAERVITMAARKSPSPCPHIDSVPVMRHPC